MIKCTFEDRGKAHLRHAVVDAIIFNDKNEILLEKRADNLTNGGKYAIPGGFLNRDETIKDAVVREVLEETGYRVEPFLLLRVADNPDRPHEDRQNVAFVYVSKILGGEITLNSEISEIKWFSLDNLPAKDQFAFDHYETIQLYLKYLREKFPLPVFGKI